MADDLISPQGLTPLTLLTDDDLNKMHDDEVNAHLIALGHPAADYSAAAGSTDTSAPAVPLVAPSPVGTPQQVVAQVDQSITAPDPQAAASYAAFTPEQRAAFDSLPEEAKAKFFTPGGSNTDAVVPADVSAAPITNVPQTDGSLPPENDIHAQAGADIATQSYGKGRYDVIMDKSANTVQQAYQDKIADEAGVLKAMKENQAEQEKVMNQLADAQKSIFTGNTIFSRNSYLDFAVILSKAAAGIYAGNPAAVAQAWGDFAKQDYEKQLDQKNSNVNILKAKAEMWNQKNKNLLDQNTIMGMMRSNQLDQGIAQTDAVVKKLQVQGASQQQVQSAQEFGLKLKQMKAEIDFKNSETAKNTNDLQQTDFETNAHQSRVLANPGIIDPFGGSDNEKAVRALAKDKNSTSQTRNFYQEGINKAVRAQAWMEDVRARANELEKSDPNFLVRAYENAVKRLGGASAAIDRDAIASDMFAQIAGSTKGIGRMGLGLDIKVSAGYLPSNMSGKDAIEQFVRNSTSHFLRSPELETMASDGFLPNLEVLKAHQKKLFPDTAAIHANNVNSFSGNNYSFQNGTASGLGIPR